MLVRMMLLLGLMLALLLARLLMLALLLGQQQGRLLLLLGRLRLLLGRLLLQRRRHRLPRCFLRPIPRRSDQLRAWAPRVRLISGFF